MYDFHYNYMVVNFKDCKVIFTDTDSFCYMIPDEEDVYAKIRGEEWFDFSNFQIDHQNYSDKNQMIPGKFKDECPNNTILEVVGLRAKMYAILTMNEDEKKAANGVSSRVKKEEIRYMDYKRCLLDNEIMYHEMGRITHKHHVLQTEEKFKKSLSPYNDKRWINKNGEEFETYSF